MDIVEIHCYRHANAVPGDVDAERKLSDKGIAQTDARLHKTGLHGYGLVITSPSRRAVETAATLASSDRKSFVVEPALYWGQDPDFDAAMNVMFAELGYASLEAYLKHDLGAYIKTHGTIAWSKVYGTVGRTTGNVQRVFVSGHAVLLQAMALEAMNINRIRAARTHLQDILQVQLGEAEGFVITMEGGVVSDFKLITG